MALKPPLLIFKNKEMKQISQKKLNKKVARILDNPRTRVVKKFSKLFTLLLKIKVK